MTDIALFEPEAVPAGLAGLDASLLADLYDVAEKYGMDVAGVEGLRRLCLDGPKTLHLSVTVPPSRQRNILVSPWAGGASVTASHMFLIRDGVASFVLWDRSFSVADVRAAIAGIDATMDATRDPLTGARRRMATDAETSALLKVDAVFSKRGTAVSSAHGDDPETFRAQFDRPGDVTIVTVADGRKFLCHRRDARGFDPGRRREAIERMIRRRGLRSEADLRALTKDEFKRMCDELDSELFSDDN